MALVKYWRMGELADGSLGHTIDPRHSERLRVDERQRRHCEREKE